MVISRKTANGLGNIIPKEPIKILKSIESKYCTLHSKTINRNNSLEIPIISSSIINIHGILYGMDCPIISRIQMLCNIHGNGATFTSLLGYFYSMENYYRLWAVQIKDLIYYMGTGCLMDEDLNPLVTMTLQLNLEQGDNFIEAVRLYIDPKVFTNPIYKSLKTTVDKILVEYYLRNPISKDTHPLLKSDLKVEIIIKEHGDFFIIPRDYITDSTEEVTDEQLNTILIENIKDLDQFI